MSLNVSAIFPASPVQEPGSRTEKSPARIVCRLASITLRSAEIGSASALECPLFPGSGVELVKVVARRSPLFMVVSCNNGNYVPQIELSFWFFEFLTERFFGSARWQNQILSRWIFHAACPSTQPTRYSDPKPTSFIVLTRKSFLDSTVFAVRTALAGSPWAGQPGLSKSRPLNPELAVFGLSRTTLRNSLY